MTARLDALLQDEPLPPPVDTTRSKGQDRPFVDDPPRVDAAPPPPPKPPAFVVEEAPPPPADRAAPPRPPAREPRPSAYSPFEPDEEPEPNFAEPTFTETVERRFERRPAREMGPMLEPSNGLAVLAVGCFGATLFLTALYLIIILERPTLLNLVLGLIGVVCMAPEGVKLLTRLMARRESSPTDDV